MKNEIETGLANFITAALLQSLDRADEIDADSPTLLTDVDIPGVQVFGASSGLTVEPRETQIVVVCERTPNLAGNLYYAHIQIAIGTEKARGTEDEHRTYQRLLRRIFRAATPPNLAPNSAHISEYLATASDGDLSGRSYAVEETDSDYSGDRFIDSFRQKHLIAVNCADPLVAKWDIDIGE